MRILGFLQPYAQKLIESLTEGHDLVLYHGFYVDADGELHGTTVNMEHMPIWLATFQVAVVGGPLAGTHKGWDLLKHLPPNINTVAIFDGPQEEQKFLKAGPRYMVRGIKLRQELPKILQLIEGQLRWRRRHRRI